MEKCLAHVRGERAETFSPFRKREKKKRLGTSARNSRPVSVSTPLTIQRPIDNLRVQPFVILSILIRRPLCDWLSSNGALFFRSHVARWSREINEKQSRLQRTLSTPNANNFESSPSILTSYLTPVKDPSQRFLPTMQPYPMNLFRSWCILRDQRFATNVRQKDDDGGGGSFRISQFSVPEQVRIGPSSLWEELYRGRSARFHKSVFVHFP